MAKVWRTVLIYRLCCFSSASICWTVCPIAALLKQLWIFLFRKALGQKAINKILGSIDAAMLVSINYGRPLSVSGRPCYILPMFIYLFIYFFYGRLILRPWLTEVRENFTRGGP